MSIPPIGRPCVSRSSLMLPKRPEPRMRGLVHVVGVGDFLVNPAVCAGLPQRTIDSGLEHTKSRQVTGACMVPRSIGHNRVSELGHCRPFAIIPPSMGEREVLGPRAAQALAAAHRTSRLPGFHAAPFRGVSHDRAAINHLDNIGPAAQWMPPAARERDLRQPLVCASNARVRARTSKTSRRSGWASVGFATGAAAAAT